MAAAVVPLFATVLTFVGVSTAAASSSLVVTTTDDSGSGSLRQAILDANANPGADTITFAIPGPGIHVITVTSTLPVITDPVTLDATTQPGWTSSPLIEVDQSAPTTSFDTLSFTSTTGGSVVAGLAFINYWHAVRTPAAITIDRSWFGVHADGTAGPGVAGDISDDKDGADVGSGSRITRSVFGDNGWTGINACGHGIEISDNLIGVLPSGNMAAPNLYGVWTNTGSASECTAPASDPRPDNVGSPGHGNVVAGNTEFGIVVSTHSVVTDNLVGFGADGHTAIPNEEGIGVGFNAGTNAQITNNIVGFSTSYGIDLAGLAPTVTGNRIGVAPDGSPAPNGKDGVLMEASTATITGNVIRNNGGAGVYVMPFNNAAVIRENHIANNHGLGIDLGTGAIGTIGTRGVTPNDPGDVDTGANGLQNFPVITSITRAGVQLTISGSLQTKPGKTAIVDLYQSQSCDPSGYGQGTQPDGSITIPVPPSGTTNWQLTIQADGLAGRTWTATATTGHGTSEFSPCSTAPHRVTPPT